MSYQPKIYRKQGAEQLVVASGGSVSVESGGSISVASGGGLTLAADGGLINPNVVRCVRKRFTAAEVNAGATILAALAGYAYRIVDLTMIAIGGAAATATSVDIVGTRGASAVRPYVVAVAALTQSAIVKPNSANVTALADGASHTPLDANTAVTISKQSGGSNLATATHIDVILSYTVEAA